MSCFTGSQSSIKEKRSHAHPTGTALCTVGKQERKVEMSFNQFRIQYLVVFGAIMLADGLQGKNISFYMGGINSIKPN